ncbi:MAG: 16S rRNA (cytosine(1402)-N(4))-methyltransferase RsmH [Flavobacteriales bacterium Tduv]
MKPVYHKPVLLTPSVEGLITDPEGVYIDATFGGGGHSTAILKRLNANGRLLAFDQDEDSIKNNLIEDKRFQLFHQNFRHIENILKFYQINGLSGILADLGVSWHQFDTAERGFSIRLDHRLDMRMNRHTGQSAEQIINQYPEKTLSEIFSTYGELKGTKKIVKKIVEKRAKKPIKTTFDLINLFDSDIPCRKKSKFLAKLFQALRIEVNDEITVLKNFLNQAPTLLKPGGRIAIISYHSLEDRLVKRFFRTGSFEGQTEEDIFGNKKKKLQPTHSKAIQPDEKEIEKNSRARSARLRIAEKI